jgi:hypothetical protein
MNENGLATTGLPRRPVSFGDFRQRSTVLVVGTARNNCTPRKSLPEKGGQQSKPSRTEAKGQAFRFPRPCLLACRGASRQFRVGEPLPNNLANGKVKALGIVHVLAIVEAKRLPIDIAEQVVRFDRNIGAVDSALQETPEVFQPVSVDILSDIFHSVVDNFMRVLFRESVIRLQRIAINRRPSFNILAYQRLQLALATFVYDLRANLSATLQNRRNDSLYLQGQCALGSCVP